MLGHTRLSDIDAELEKLAIDPCCSPRRIAHFRKQPTEINEHQSVDGAERRVSSQRFGRRHRPIRRHPLTG
jgi:hypothetical protein